MTVDPGRLDTGAPHIHIAHVAPTLMGKAPVLTIHFLAAEGPLPQECPSLADHLAADAAQIEQARALGRRMGWPVPDEAPAPVAPALAPNAEGWPACPVCGWAYVPDQHKGVVSIPPSGASNKAAVRRAIEGRVRIAQEAEADSAPLSAPIPGPAPRIAK